MSSMDMAISMIMAIITSMADSPATNCREDASYCREKISDEKIS